MSTVHTPAYQRFLKRLAAARKGARLTQRDLAAQLGKPPSFVAKCETGERRVDVIELARFAEVYHKPIRYFVD